MYIIFPSKWLLHIFSWLKHVGKLKCKHASFRFTHSLPNFPRVIFSFFFFFGIVCGGLSGCGVGAASQSTAANEIELKECQKHFPNSTPWHFSLFPFGSLFSVPWVLVRENFMAISPGVIAQRFNLSKFNERFVFSFFLFPQNEWSFYIEFIVAVMWEVSGGY